MSRPGFDAAAIYRTARERLVMLAPTLKPEQLATPVPTCPGWSVHDVYAHLAGLSSDVVEGEVSRPGSPEATAVQVADRRATSIGELTAEWSANASEIERRLAEGTASVRLAIDAWSHDQDVHNALGIVSGREGPGLELTVSGVWRLKRILAEAGTAPLRIITADRVWTIGDGEPGATLTIDTYELARMLLGRRSRAQMLAYQWQGDPEPYLAVLPVFGPADTDIVE